MVTNISKGQFQVQGEGKRKIPEAYLKVARGVEQQFVQYMLKQMKKTVNTANPESSALNFYKSILNNHQSRIMVEKNGGLGLQKIILDQIYPHNNKNKTLSKESNRKIIQNYRGTLNE